MNSEVFIENNRLDLSQDLSSLLSFAIDDIKDFAARNCTFSKTIVFPGTKNNNGLFGNIFDATVSNPYEPAQDNVGINFNASVSAQCLMVQDNMQVFKGILRLMKIVITNNVPEYECAVFGELGGFVLALGNKKLEDLDFSAYDHTLNTANIIASWDTINGTGYYYPLVDVGGVSQDKVDYDITAFRPALYIREYISKIFEDSGYTFTSDLFDTARFKSLILPFNLKTLRSAETTLMTATRTTRYKVVDNIVGDQDEDLKFETFTGTGWSANVDKNEFTYTDSPQLQATIFFSILGDYEIDTSSKSISLKIMKNGVEIPGYSKLLTGHSGSSSQPYVWQFSFDITLNQNDIIKFNYLGQLDVVNIDAFATNCIFQVTSLVPVYAPAGDGDDIEMSQVIPRNILQKDFISSVIKLFNLYLYEDTTSKHILITPYVDFFSTTQSVDWTYKMDRSKSISLSPMSELNSRYYNFVMKADNDYYNELYRKRYNESYGDRIFDSEFEFANEKTDIPVLFSPSVLIGYAGVDKIVVAMYKLNAGVEEKTDVNPRILQAKKITGVTSWSIMDGLTTLSSGLTDYGYAGNYDDPDAPANDIHFGVPKELFFTLATGAINVTQFNVYWSPYMAEITDKDSKLLAASFKLTNKDIFDLDFKKPVHLDSSLWRLNKIEDWNATDPDVCKVELLKIINLIY